MAERWPLPSDLQMEIDLHDEPTASWVVDYFKRGRNPQEIVLRIKGPEVVGKETKVKDVGVVCFTRPNDAGLEIWFELLKNKQIKRTILPMVTWEHDDLLPKGKDGVQDISDDIGTNEKYSEALSSLRFKLLFENKSHNNMWEFIELCHTYSVDLTQLGKVAQTLVFKKHSDKNFDFVDYMERKGLKITLPSTGVKLSGAAGTSTSGEGSKKLKRKAPVKKLNVLTPKKPTTETVEAPKKPTTRTVEAPKKAKATVEAPKKAKATVEAPTKKIKMGPTRESPNPKKGTPGVTPELQASKLLSGTSADTTGQKPKTVKFKPPSNHSATLPSKVGSSEGRTSSTSNAPRTSPEQSVQPSTVNPGGHSGDGGSVVDSGKKNLQVVEYNDESGDEDTSSKTKKRKASAVLQKKTGFQPERAIVEMDQEAADVKMQLDPKTKDQFKPEFDELRKYFPLGDKLVWASISQLTDPDATAVYRPCSIRHVVEIQNSMIGSADTLSLPLLFLTSSHRQRRSFNILTMKELKTFIKSGGRSFMAESSTVSSAHPLEQGRE
ncbi:hypothetical protein R1sor_000523 [Riccia sorocarpa]|uniref:Uncharacterized protein n=1 Tax=Riccia sorocarpa TaxID=122646 RepID=A0ABD3GVA7_9MARC